MIKVHVCSHQILGWGSQQNVYWVIFLGVAWIIGGLGRPLVFEPLRGVEPAVSDTALHLELLANAVPIVSVAQAGLALAVEDVLLLAANVAAVAIPHVAIVTLLPRLLVHHPITAEPVLGLKVQRWGGRPHHSGAGHR